MNQHYLYDVVMNNKVLIGLMVTAIISTMPAADCVVSWRTLYAWIYDAAHLFLNFKRPSMPAGSPPAQPKP
jgi:hypothetical protein